MLDCAFIARWQDELHKTWRKRTQGFPETRTLPGPSESEHMLHKVLIGAVSSQAARLLINEKGLPGPDVERHLKTLLQSALSKLDVVSREEFETQQLVLQRTRERLEALEKRVAAIEQGTQPPST